MAKSVELEDLWKLRTPFVMHVDLCHYVVVERMHPNGALVHDPAFGSRTFDERELDERYTGVVIEVDAKEFLPMPPPETRISWLDTGALKSLHKVLWPILWLTVALQSTVIILPQLTQRMLDHSMETEALMAPFAIALGAAFLLAFDMAMGVMRSWFLMDLGAKLGRALGGRLAHHLIRLPISYFEEREAGEVLSRFKSLDSIRVTLTSGLVSTAVDSVTAILVLVVMFMYSPGMAFVSLSATTAYLIVRVHYSPKLRAMSEAVVSTAASEQTFATETVRGIATIRASGLTNPRYIGWLSLMIDNLNAGLGVGRVQIRIALWRDALQGLEYIALLVLCVVAVQRGVFTIGMVVAFLAYRSQFSGRAAQLIDAVAHFDILRMHLSRLEDIVLTRAAKRNKVRTTLEANVAIAIRNLSFKYPGQGGRVLSNVNLEIRHDELVVVRGPSGTGKSTLLKLVLGFLEPECGVVQINATDARGNKSRLGVVLQSDQLFSATILENITSFSVRPDVERVRQVCEICAIHEDINAMPLGYFTRLADDGATVSGGQKQRILLARALYQRPSLLLLDEATSHLDPELEERIHTALRQLRVTRLVISHRLSSLEQADRTYVLMNGALREETRRVVGSGSIP